jgi:opacity protein-like surface antigen
MHTRGRALAAALAAAALMVVAAAGSAGVAQARDASPAAAPSAVQGDRTVPFRPGETLTYNVGWSTYFTAGTATMRVQERRPLGGGRAAYVLVAEGKPGTILSALYDLYYKVETQLDTRTLLPLTASVFSKEGSRTRVKTTHFKGAGRTADFELRTSNVSRRRLAVQPYTQDALSAIYVLRTLPFKAPDMMRMPVTTGGDVYRATLHYGPPETVRTGAGTFQAWKVTITAIDQDGKPAARSMAVWFSDDARKLPVKIEAGLAVGSFTLTLASAR